MQANPLPEVTIGALERSEEDLLRLLGFLLLQHGQSERAACFFDALGKIDPQDQQVVLSRACALIRCGAAQRGLDLLDSLPYPSFDPMLTALLRSQALFRLDRRIEAAKAMRSFVRLRNHANGEAG